MEIDHEYHKGKIFKVNKNNYLPFIIDRIPNGITSDKSLEYKNNGYYKRFDNEIIKISKVTNRHVGIDSVKFIIYIAITFGIIMPLYMVIMNGVKDLTMVYIDIFIGLAFLLFAYYKWKKALKQPEEVFVEFDRLKTLISLPKPCLLYTSPSPRD